MKQLYKNGDDLYVILRQIKISSLSNKDGTLKNELFNAWKNFLGADKVLKNQTHFIYCENVNEVTWEDIPNEEVNQLESTN